jgi:hypothetical protein
MAINVRFMEPLRMNLSEFYPTRLQMNYRRRSGRFLSARRPLPKRRFFMLFISEIHPSST